MMERVLRNNAIDLAVKTSIALFSIYCLFMVWRLVGGFFMAGITAEHTIVSVLAILVTLLGLFFAVGVSFLIFTAWAILYRSLDHRKKEG